MLPSEGWLPAESLPRQRPQIQALLGHSRPWAYGEAEDGEAFSPGGRRVHAPGSCPEIARGCQRGERPL